MSLNNMVVVTGNLGVNPELKRTNEDGGLIVSLSIGQNEVKWDELKKEFITTHTNWISVTSFGLIAEKSLSELRTGDRVLVEGKLRASSFETKDGKKAKSIEVIAQSIQKIEFLKSNSKEHSFDDFHESSPTL